MGDNRPARYEENGVVVYRASALNMCDKMFVALANGYTPKAHPAWFQEVLDEGSMMEHEIIAMYQETRDREVIGGQSVVELEVTDGVIIRGSIDGIVVGAGGTGGDSPLFEAKKFRESTWGKFRRQGVEAMPWYPWQVSAYMHGLGVDECEFVGGLYDGEHIIDIEVKHLAMPPIPLIAIQKRVAKLEGIINSGKVPDQVPCTVRMYPCPMFYLHDEDDQFQPPVQPAPDQVIELITRLDQVKSRASGLRKEVDELDKERKLINEGIKAWMELSGVDDDQTVTVEDESGKPLATVKYHTSFVKGYEVGESERTAVTVKPVKESAKRVPRAPARGKK